MYGMQEGGHGQCGGCHCHCCCHKQENMTPEQKKEMLAAWREKLEKKLERIKEKEAELAGK